MSDKSKQNKNNGQARLSDGQVLVELMVAISVMVIGLLGIFTLLSQSLGLNRVAADQYIAANLAAEGVEVAKNILDHNVIERNPWNEGLERDGEFGLNTQVLPLTKISPMSFLNSIKIPEDTIIPPVTKPILEE